MKLPKPLKKPSKQSLCRLGLQSQEYETFSTSANDSNVACHTSHDGKYCELDCGVNQTYTHQDNMQYTQPPLYISLCTLASTSRFTTSIDTPLAWCVCSVPRIESLPRGKIQKCKARCVWKCRQCIIRYHFICAYYSETEHKVYRCRPT